MLKKIVAILFVLLSIVSVSAADECWILCQPDSYVNVRPNANKKGSPVAYMECGYKVETDNKTKNNFVHLIGVGEAGEGWINEGYVVYSEPIKIDRKVYVESDGRVACFKQIGGKRRCWVKNGDSVTLHFISEEWSITNKGFVRTKYLGVNYDSIAERMAETTNDGESDVLYYENEEGQP